MERRKHIKPDSLPDPLQGVTYLHVLILLDNDICFDELSRISGIY